MKQKKKRNQIFMNRELQSFLKIGKDESLRNNKLSITHSATPPPPPLFQASNKNNEKPDTAASLTAIAMSM